MQPRSLLEIKKVIRETDVGKARAALDQWTAGEAPDLTLAQMLNQSQLNH